VEPLQGNLKSSRATTEGAKSLRTRLAGPDLALVRLGLRGRVLGLAGGALGEVGLVPLPLRVRQVVPLVVVQRQAEFALVASHRGEKSGISRPSDANR
jgi:hypothetical protein